MYKDKLLILATIKLVTMTLSKGLPYIFVLCLCAFAALAETNLSDQGLATSGNVTLGQKIQFSLGNILEEISGLWLRLTGNLEVSGNVTANSFQGDINASYIQEPPWQTGNETDTYWPIQGSKYMANDSGVLVVNESVLNSTIVAKTLFPMGEIYLYNNTLSTNIQSKDTWTVINGVWRGNNESMLFQNFTNGALKYVGQETMFFHVAMTLSAKSAGANDIMRAAVFKNGVLLPGAEIEQYLFAAGDIGSTAIHVATTLSYGDTLSVYLYNEVDADDITVSYANLFAMGMRMG